MASIESPVTLAIHKNVPTQGQALVQVTLTIRATGDDVQGANSYNEVVELLSEGSRVGDAVSEGPVSFSGTNIGSTRTAEKQYPLATLIGGAAPAQDVSIVARVSLTPIPPSQDSNTVVLQQQVINP